MLANSLQRETLSDLSADIQRPFACGLCGKHFARLAMLDKHRCRAAVRNSQILTDDSAVGGLRSRSAADGSGNVPVKEKQLGTDESALSGYMCGECGENFANESAVYSHMLTKHMCEYASRFCFGTRYRPLFRLHRVHSIDVAYGDTCHT